MVELYVAGVSLSSNPRDISPYTLDTIKKASVIIGEERKTALRLIKVSGAEEEKDLYLINEHSSDSDRQAALKAVLSADIAVFFSDAGTPCISDPDYRFIKMCREKGVIIKTLPGPSSVTSAISVSGIEAKRFFFAGFPPKSGNERIKFFKNIFNTHEVTVFMERPYALESTLKDIIFIDRAVSVSLNIGCNDERTLYGLPKELLKELSGIKAPFIVVVPGANKKKQKHENR